MAATPALEGKLDSERKAGGVLIEMKEKGELAMRRRPKGSQLASLSDLGLDKEESYRWQLVASLPDPAYESWKAETRKNRGEITEAEVLDIAEKAKIAKARKRRPATVKTPGFPDGPFRVIVIDPPWPMEKSERKAGGDGKY